MGHGAEGGHNVDEEGTFGAGDEGIVAGDMVSRGAVGGMTLALEGRDDEEDEISVWSGVHGRMCINCPESIGGFAGGTDGRADGSTFMLVNGKFVGRLARGRTSMTVECELCGLSSTSPDDDKGEEAEWPERGQHEFDRDPDPDPAELG